MSEIMLGSSIQHEHRTYDHLHERRGFIVEHKSMTSNNLSAMRDLMTLEVLNLRSTMKTNHSLEVFICLVLVLNWAILFPINNNKWLWWKEGLLENNYLNVAYDGITLPPWLYSVEPGIRQTYFSFNSGIPHLWGSLVLCTIEFSTSNYNLLDFF